MSAAGAAGASTDRLTITFRGSYTLGATAGQETFHPGGAGCVPGSAQHESETVSWTMRFASVDLTRLLIRGRLVVPGVPEIVRGSHVWDEASTECPSTPAGHLVCRTHFSGRRPELALGVLRGRIVLHPTLDLVSNTDECTGEVANEHPDCGSRDQVGVSDFAFRRDLARYAPSLPVRIAVSAASPVARRFDIPRSGSCSKPGERNPNTIRQSVTAHYRGSFTFARRK